MTFTDPAQLVHAAFVALQAEDWLGVASLCDEVSLRAFKRHVVEEFAPRAPEMQITAELIMQHSSDMPRAVAEYEVERYRKNFDPVRRLQHELLGVPSVDALMAMEPGHVFASWLEGSSPRRRIAHLVELGHIPPAAAASAQANAPAFPDCVVLGTVVDGPDIAHVVFRPNIDEAGALPREAMTHLERLPLDERQLVQENRMRHVPRLARCRRQPDGAWRLHADHNFLGAGQMGSELTKCPL